MFIEKLKTYRNELASQRLLRKKIAQKKGELKVILGAASTEQEGWIATNYPQVNVVDKGSMANFFSIGEVQNFVAEHVWEHLTEDEALVALKNCYDYLMPGGCLRIAVPDGFHNDPKYIEHVRPGGTGRGDHQVLYNYLKLSELFTKAGFETIVLEYFDEHGEFHYQPWSIADGFVLRSTGFDPRNKKKSTIYTSLIVDGVKAVKRKC